MKAALWREQADLDFADPEADGWAFQTVESRGSSKVKGITVSDIIRKYEIDHIDLLKIDIEGSEKEVFETAREWIDRVGAIAVEIHDRFKPGCSTSVNDATRDFPERWTTGYMTFMLRG